MLTSTVVYLTPVEDCALTPTMGRHAHALFLSLIQRVDPALSDALHGPTSQKPFTVSPLQGRFRREKGNGTPYILLSSRSTYWMRFTTLSQDVFEPLLDYFLQSDSGFELRIQGALFIADKLVTTPSTETRWSGYTDWRALANSSRPSRTVTVRFHSPTTFRQTEGNTAQPHPELVFGSWWDKWNAFAPNPVHMPRDERSRVLASINIAQCDISTRMLDFGPFKQVGFVGRVTYDLSRLPENERRWLDLLARFSFYCGTGAKTTMGMGQTFCGLGRPAVGDEV